MIQHAMEVMTCQDAKGTAKAVLSNLAIRADENDQCWPGRERIAADVGISIRAVSSALKTLSEAGLIDIERKQHGQIFTLQMCRICTSNQGSDVQDIPSDVQISSSDVQISSSDVQDMHPKGKERSIESKGKGKDSPAAVDDIDNLFRAGMITRRKPDLTTYKPPQEHEDLYYRCVDAFPVTRTFPERFEELIKHAPDLMFKHIEGWLKTQKETRPHDTIFIGNAVNYFKQNPPKAKQYQYQPDQYGAI